MGRRHLKGLVRAGCQVTAFDPSEASAQAAREELIRAGLPAERLRTVTDPAPGKFDLAVFAETADHRFASVTRFAQASAARRVLLEKPLSGNPQEVEAYASVLPAAQVNFPRHLWPSVIRLKELCGASTRVDMTLNGGAFGFGCNGIHFLDLFLHLSGAGTFSVPWSQLSDVPVASGRGARFRDYGGRFVVETPRGALLCSGASESSAPVSMCIRGDHFAAWIDESDLTWRLTVRDPASRLPNYRYGGEYRVEAQGPLDVPPLDVVTERWARGEAALPSLAESMPAHRLLERILRAGGAAPPYAYT